MGRLLSVWAAGALALAASRVPYDDEWFSIELAFDARAEQFWFALRDDVHPPWLALLDRAIAALWPVPTALQALRIAASALAINLCARSLSGPLQLPRWIFALAACHPILLFYAGSARWYPFLFLAHALRLSAIVSDKPAVHGRKFVAGALLGPLAGYVDALFLVHDSAWFAVRARGSGASWKRLGALALAAAGCAILPLWVSPLRGGSHALSSPWLPRWDLSSVATWAALGLAGETALPWPLLLLGFACVASAGWALVIALRDARTRGVACLVLSYSGVWLVACGYGVWHPRYSLLLWLLVLALVWSRWPRCGRLAGSLHALSALHLLVGLALAGAGFGFLKADLNRLNAADCRQLRAAEAASALIVPYRRLAQLGERQCGLHAPILSVPSIRISPGEAEQLADVRKQLETPGDYWLFSIQTDSTMAVTQDRVRGALSQRCAAREDVSFGEIPHPDLRRERSAAYRRFRLERFECRPAHNGPLAPASWQNPRDRP